MSYRDELAILGSIDSTLKKMLALQMYAVGIENHVDITFESQPYGEKVVAKNKKGKKLSKAKLQELSKSDPYAFNFYMNNGYLPEDDPNHKCNQKSNAYGNTQLPNMYGNNYMQQMVNGVLY